MAATAGLAGAVAGGLAFASPAFAATSEISAADTAWMIVATALVLMMTIPGLALFYSGMVRKKNVLATMAQSLSAVMIISILWVMTFAIITVALVAGSVADRMRFSAYVMFSIGWFGLVYVPLAHWIWGGGFLSSMGVIDYAGGLVVHLSAGTGGLVAALVMGRRQGYGTENLSPFDLSLAVVGTGLLWVGWFGFNGGSALAANSHAVMAILATHLAACAGAITWGAIEWSARRKPSVLGMISGAVAGLGTITPASGFVAPWHGIVIGVLAGLICYWACTWLKHRFNYDDSLDVFGVHGIGGLTGTLLAGVFATSSIGGVAGLLEGHPQQLLSQVYGVAVTLVWSGGVTYGLLKLVSAFVPLRVSREHELEGLDITQHGEALQ
jgi:Amt family ammonium transporter